ncbi:hypothetical protein C8R45DRAFT_940817 [Mycena sanguinolenta]|nr:hypothetical protein C8R45DRAFT_940817 [Mycena sanguinolenta]
MLHALVRSARSSAGAEADAESTIIVARRNGAAGAVVEGMRSGKNAVWTGWISKCTSGGKGEEQASKETYHEYRLRPGRRCTFDSCALDSGTIDSVTPSLLRCVDAWIVLKARMRTKLDPIRKSDGGSRVYQPSASVDIIFLVHRWTAVEGLDRQAEWGACERGGLGFRDDGRQRHRFVGKRSVLGVRPLRVGVKTVASDLPASHRTRHDAAPKAGKRSGEPSALKPPKETTGAKRGDGVDGYFSIMKTRK